MGWTYLRLGFIGILLGIKNGILLGISCNRMGLKIELYWIKNGDFMVIIPFYGDYTILLDYLLSKMVIHGDKMR